MYESGVVEPGTAGVGGGFPWEGVPAGPGLAAVLLGVEVSRLSAEAAASWAAASQRLEAHVEARRYAALARFGEMSGFRREPAAPVGADQPVCPGGAGTPAVSEFAVIDLGIALCSTTGRAAHLLGDGLDLAYRMPRLFAGLAAGVVAGYKVRLILKAARWLSVEAAAELDAQIGDRAARLGPTRLEELVQQIGMRLDPETAAARAAAAKTTRRVWMGKAEDGLRHLSGTVDAFHGLAFDAALDTIAGILADLGGPGSKDERRADALGWLANPAAALTLLHRHRAWKHTHPNTTHPDPGPGPDVGDACPPGWDSGPDTEPGAGLPDEPGDPPDDRLCPGRWRTNQPTPWHLLDPTLWPTARVVLHITRREWAARSGAAHLDGHGPITLTEAITTLGHHQVTITPLIDLADTPISTADTFTGTLREAVLLANPHTPFPYADTHTRPDDDIDHTIPHNHGGPTSLDNGGPLRRRQHRFKTHHHWQVKQPFPGIFIWQSPHGHTYICDRHGNTHHLDE